jgi:hypothetical protein
MNFLNRYADSVYSIMRLIVGLMLACHGLQLVFGMFGGMPGSSTPMIHIGGWLQLVGGFLIAFGLLTRLAAFICSGMFAVAYFMIHVALPLPQRQSLSRSRVLVRSSRTTANWRCFIAGSFSSCSFTARVAGVLTRYSKVGRDRRARRQRDMDRFFL